MGAKGASSDDLVAAGPARVGVVPAHHGDELPVVKARTQFELEHTRGVDLLGLHARVVRALLGLARRAACPYDELADAPCRRTFATGGYAGEALVAVGVPREDHVGLMVVELIPEAPHLVSIADITGSKERFMEVSKSALRFVTVEVTLKPAP